MTESFEIPYPPTAIGKKAWMKRFGMNAYYAGKHWSVRREDAEFWHLLTRYEMSRQKVRTTPFQKPVIITFHWNDRLDCSNHAVMAKMIEDAMEENCTIQIDFVNYKLHRVRANKNNNSFSWLFH